MVFWVFFEVLILLWCLFGVSGIVPKVLNMLVFFSPSFGGSCGVGYFCLFGFRRFRCFGVLVFVFFVCVGFVSVVFVCFCFVVGLFLVLVLVLFLFFLGFCFLFDFDFSGGFKGQVRWPKGPPHLALNPPYFVCFFVFLLCFFFFVFLSLF